MELTVKTKIKVDLKTLVVKAGARYWEDSTVNGVEDEKGDLIPCRKGEYWCPIIDIETGKITNWEQGKKAEIHYKVCDDGLYKFKDAEGKTILQKSGYVPAILCPTAEGKGYGDYVIMHINEDGIIEDWHVKDEYLKEFNSVK